MVPAVPSYPEPVPTGSNPTLVVSPSNVTRIDIDWMGGAPRLRTDALAEATGWTLNDDGLCRGDVCVPDRIGLDVDGSVDLVALADALDAPIVVDAEIPAVALGAERTQRALALSNAQLPPFELPDLDGTAMPSSTWADKKKVLVVFASW